MANSTAYTEIGKIVDKYCFVKQLPQDDYWVYLQMACNCYREISLKYSNKFLTTKISVSDLGIIEMPLDMVGFKCLYVAFNGEIWSFTLRDKKVMTTTLINGVESQDDTFGEGVDVLDNRYIGFGARGGVNAYYMNIDWGARRIFCDGFKSDTAVLQYLSSGLVVGGSTFIDQQCEPVINSYIDWQREINTPRSIAMLDKLESYYTNALFSMRLFQFLPSRDELSDAWDSNSTQTIQR